MLFLVPIRVFLVGAVVDFFRRPGFILGCLCGYLFGVLTTAWDLETVKEGVWVNTIWDTLRCVHWRPLGHKDCDCASFENFSWPYDQNEFFHWLISCRVEGSENYPDPSGVHLWGGDLGSVSKVASAIWKHGHSINRWLEAPDAPGATYWWPFGF